MLVYTQAYDTVVIFVSVCWNICMEVHVPICGHMCMFILACMYVYVGILFKKVLISLYVFASISGNRLVHKYMYKYMLEYM